MVDRTLSELIAHSKTGMPSTDHNGRNAHCYAIGPIQLTLTVTFVGLVTTSNTAERFCDCATMASIS